MYQGHEQPRQLTQLQLDTYALQVDGIFKAAAEFFGEGDGDRWIAARMLAAAVGMSEAQQIMNRVNELKDPAEMEAAKILVYGEEYPPQIEQ